MEWDCACCSNLDAGYFLKGLIYRTGIVSRYTPSSKGGMPVFKFSLYIRSTRFAGQNIIEHSEYITNGELERDSFSQEICRGIICILGDYYFVAGKLIFF